MALADGRRRALKGPILALADGGRRALSDLDSVELVGWRRSALVAAIAFLAYANALALGFSHDDVPLVRENALVQNGPSFAIAAADYWSPLTRSGLWRPLTIFSFALERSLFGPGPSAAHFHVVNVLLHAAASIALLALLDRLRAAPFAGLAAAALFAAHPIHTEAVANVVGRAELLAALFAFLALRAHAGAGAGEGGSTVAAPVFFALALLSKEHAAVVPGIALAADLAARRRPIPWARWAALGGVLAAYLVARWLVLRGFAPAEIPFVNNPLVAATPLEKALAVPALALRAAGLALLPVRLSADYSYRSIELPVALLDPAVLAGAAVVLAALVGLVVAVARRRTVAATALALAVLPYAVVSHALVPLGTLFGERLLYLPSTGVAILLGLAIDRVLAGRARIAVTGGLVAAGVALSLARNPVWDSNLALWTATAERFPTNAKAQAYLAGARLDAFEATRDPRDLEAARAAAMASARAWPEFAAAWYVNGRVALAEKDDARAIAALEKSIALEDAWLPRIRLGEARARRSEWAEAERAFARCVELRPESAVSRSNLAAAHASLGREREARAGFERALALDPGLRDATTNLFRLLLHASDPSVRDEKAARALARRVLAIEPGNAEARALLGS